MTRVIVITQTDDEYGYNIFFDVASSPEIALDICNQFEAERKHHKLPLELNPEKTQVVETKDGKIWNTVFYLEEKFI